MAEQEPPRGATNGSGRLLTEAECRARGEAYSHYPEHPFASVNGAEPEVEVEDQPGFTMYVVEPETAT